MVTWPSQLQQGWKESLENGGFFQQASRPERAQRRRSSRSARFAPMVANHFRVRHAAEPLDEVGLGDRQEEQPDAGPHHDAEDEGNPVQGKMSWLRAPIPCGLQGCQACSHRSSMSRQRGSGRVTPASTTASRQGGREVGGARQGARQGECKQCCQRGDGRSWAPHKH